MTAALLTNSVHLLREYALEHAGIVCLPTLVAGDPILRGELKVVLPEHQLSSFSLSAVYAGTSRNAFKLRLFIEHITAAFTRVAPWDAAMVERGLLPAELVGLTFRLHRENPARLTAFGEQCGPHLIPTGGAPRLPTVRSIAAPLQGRPQETSP